MNQLTQQAFNTFKEEFQSYIVQASVIQSALFYGKEADQKSLDEVAELRERSNLAENIFKTLALEPNKFEGSLN